MRAYIHFSMKNAAQTECSYEAGAFILMSSLKLMGSHQTAKQSCSAQPSPLTSFNSLACYLRLVYAIMCFFFLLHTHSCYRSNAPERCCFWCNISFLWRWQQHIPQLYHLVKPIVCAHSSHIHVFMHAYVQNGLWRCSTYIVELNTGEVVRSRCARDDAKTLISEFIILCDVNHKVTTTDPYGWETIANDIAHPFINEH